MTGRPAPQDVEEGCVEPLLDVARSLDGTLDGAAARTRAMDGRSLPFRATRARARAQATALAADARSPALARHAARRRKPNRAMENRRL